MEVARHGDTTIGVKTDIIVDERLGLVAEKKTVVAEVPVEGGGTAIIAGEQIRAVSGVSDSVNSVAQLLAYYVYILHNMCGYLES